jgi:hypothetical protein
MGTNTLTKTVAKPANGNLRNDVQSVMKILDTFGQLLAEETTALRKSDFKTVDRLQAAKKNLAAEYQALVVGLSERKAEVAALEMPLREKLVKSRTGFTQILQENLTALETAKASAGRLVNKILDAARKAVVDDKQTNYSAKGQAQAYKTSTLSLSVDKNL